MSCYYRDGGAANCWSSCHDKVITIFWPIRFRNPLVLHYIFYLKYDPYASYLRCSTCPLHLYFLSFPPICKCFVLLKEGMWFVLYKCVRWKYFIWEVTWWICAHLNGLNSTRSQGNASNLHYRHSHYSQIQKCVPVCERLACVITAPKMHPSSSHVSHIILGLPYCDVDGF